MKLWNGKKKAITFSFDDGVTQDVRLVKILNKYGLKATFNINSSLLGLESCLDIEGVKINHNKINPSEVNRIYEGHEVAVHTLTHPNLTTLKDEIVVWQVEEDRKMLEKLTGYHIVSMAYPCGGVNNDDRVAQIIKDSTKLKCARTIKSTYNFDLQDNLYRFNPTIHFIECEKLFKLGKEFLELKIDEPKLFYIWGHSFELDTNYITWEQFEEFCAMISKKDDVFYGTNKETLLCCGV